MTFLQYVKKCKEDAQKIGKEIKVTSFNFGANEKALFDLRIQYEFVKTNKALVKSNRTLVKATWTLVIATILLTIISFIL